MACSAVSTPAPAAAVISPTLCPAPAAICRKASAGCGNRASSETSPLATISGWATAVSRMVSASDSVPCVTRSIPATADSQASRSSKPGSSSQGRRKPGVWEPCPGQAMTSTFLPSPVGMLERAADADQPCVVNLEGSYKRVASVTDHDDVPVPAGRASASSGDGGRRVVPDSRPRASAMWTTCASRGCITS